MVGSLNRGTPVWSAKGTPKKVPMILGKPKPQTPYNPYRSSTTPLRAPLISGPPPPPPPQIIAPNFGVWAIRIVPYPQAAEPGTSEGLRVEFSFIVPLKQVCHGVYGDPIIIYSKPYSICLKGTVCFKV